MHAAMREWYQLFHLSTGVCHLLCSYGLADCWYHLCEVAEGFIQSIGTSSANSKSAKLICSYQLYQMKLPLSTALQMPR